MLLQVLETAKNVLRPSQGNMRTNQSRSAKQFLLEKNVRHDPNQASKDTWEEGLLGFILMQVMTVFFSQFVVAQPQDLS